MKVVILVEWYHPIGGVEAFVWRLVKHLNPDIRITLAVCFVGPKTRLESPTPNLEIVDVTHGSFGKVLRLIKQEKPDVIHTNHLSVIGLAGYWAGRKYGIPAVVTNHQVPEYGVLGWERFTNPLIWLYVRLLDKQATAVIAPSPTVCPSSQSAWNPQQCPNHFLRSKYRPIPAQRKGGGAAANWNQQ